VLFKNPGCDLKILYATAVVAVTTMAANNTRRNQPPFDPFEGSLREVGAFEWFVGRVELDCERFLSKVGSVFELAGFVWFTDIGEC